LETDYTPTPLPGQPQPSHSANGRCEERDEDLPPDNPWQERGLSLQRLSSAYRIDLGQWFLFAGAHYSRIIAPTIGFLVLYLWMFLAAHLVHCGGVIFHMFVNPALQAGFYVVYLAQLKGRRWSFADFFAGFNWYGALLFNYVLTVLIAVGCLLPFVVLVALVENLPAHPNRWLVLVAGSVVIVLSGGYFFIRLTCFNVLLILDRHCTPIEAIRGSWQLSEGHVLRLFGVWMFLGALALAGLLLLVVGFFFTAPLAGMIYTAGYLLIAGSRHPHRFPGRRLDQSGKLFLEEL
jgi:uncharacterized membrane protein